MPNWCDNMVTLRHSDKAKVDALDAEMSKRNAALHFEGQLLQYLVPNPSGEWNYDWSVANWGTKWDASIIDYERRDDNEVWVSFESAWSPPTVAYDTLVEQGWEVEAVYYEPGMGFGGVYKDGDDDYHEYDIADPDSIKDLPLELIEFGDLETKTHEYMIEQLEETWADAKRTGWHTVEDRPEYDGYYEIKVKGYDPKQEYIHFCEFKEGEWDYWTIKNILGWRGLAKDPGER
jgi:hypothetical protein